MQYYSFLYLKLKFKLGKSLHQIKLKCFPFLNLCKLLNAFKIKLGAEYNLYLYTKHDGYFIIEIKRLHIMFINFFKPTHYVKVRKCKIFSIALIKEIIVNMQTFGFSGLITKITGTK